MRLPFCSITFLSVALAVALPHAPAFASPPADTDAPAPAGPVLAAFRKSLNRPTPEAVAGVRAMRQAIEDHDRLMREDTPLAREAVSRIRFPRAKTGTDRVLVILVEFDDTKTDSFLWTPGQSTWDPLGLCNSAEYDGTNIGNAAASAKLAEVNGIQEARTFNYSGPAHNQIPRPLSATDRSGEMVWTPDFSPQWYRDLIFGNGVQMLYTRQDGSQVNESFLGKSVRQYFEDLSGGLYSITGEVLGWVKVPHSVWWYGADPCPGARSGVSSGHNGGIPGAGNARTLVQDALEAAKAAYPSLNWRLYDQNGDGVIDRLWIIHAGLGEEDSTVLLNRTSYGEGGMWSHSSSLSPYYPFWSDGSGVLYAGPYIMMPENCGISVLAHEFAHNLGADDLYAYGKGQTSAGFWTLMADNWTGYPIGFLPPALDPWHLDNWGWLNPVVVTDTKAVTRVRLGQASAFPGGSGVARGARIPLPDQSIALPVQPLNGRQWWGGAEDLTNGAMRTVGRITIPASGTPTLTFKAAWDIETGWDFLWVMLSEDGTTWTPITNANTSAAHDAGWIGGAYGLPDDLAAAGYGGFTGRNASWPGYQSESFDLSAWKGRSVYLRFWYMTDWSTLGTGPFIDDIRILSGSTTLFADTAASGSSLWQYTAPWSVNDGTRQYTHNYYLQWRNASATGGYDASLGDSRYRYGPVNSGLLVWYNNNRYADNEVFNHLTDWPGFGPKGRMLVVDAHPEPYRYPYWVSYGYANEAANVTSRSLMRDAPFSQTRCNDFVLDGDSFTGYAAEPRFDDGRNYYPGAEYVRRGPGYDPSDRKWITRQWDAGVVQPSKVFSGVKASGYTAAEEFRYSISIYTGGYISAYKISGLGYNGGTGNPGAVGGQYGWNAKILSQSASEATVAVWNALELGPLVPVADRYSVSSYSQTLNVAAPGVLSNDSGPADWASVAYAELASWPEHGSVVWNADGSFTYTPTAGTTGSDRFTYRLRTSPFGPVSAAQTVVIRLPGDANRDGAVNASDARLVLSAAGGLHRGDAAGFDVANADMDGDGRISLTDATRLARFLGGKGM